jgi:phage terminase Nu1 subunit (DNA packaging protein)
MTEVNATQLAFHLGRTTIGTIADYVAKGWIKKLPNGKFDLDECRDRAFANLRAERRGVGPSKGSASLAEAKANLVGQQFEAAAIKNAVARGDYVALEEMIRLVIAMIMVCRERLLAIPGKISDACAMRTREEIDAIMMQELSEALDELSTTPLDVRRGIRRDDEGDVELESAAAPKPD